MRSTEPIPGNPWPHDMVITVEDNPHALIELLWIREAWNLRPKGDDLPPLLAETPVAAHIEAAESGQISIWQEAWTALWGASLHHASLVRDIGLFAKLRETADGSAERAELLHQFAGPTWHDRFGDEAFTDHYKAWDQAWFGARSPRRQQSLTEDPERVSLAALIPAWRAGLNKVVIIPCLGTYTRVIGQHCLLMTTETRNAPQQYSEALRQFR